MNFIVMYADSKFVCLQKYEFPYDFDEKYVLKMRWGGRSLPKSPVPLLHVLFFAA